MVWFVKTELCLCFVFVDAYASEEEIKQMADDKTFNGYLNFLNRPLLAVWRLRKCVGNVAACYFAK